MEPLEFVKNLRKKINEYTNKIGPSLEESEKDLLEILPQLLDYIYYIIQNYDIINENKQLDELSSIKDKLLEFLEKKKYSKSEFYILEVGLFDKSSKYLTTLIENLYFYFERYKLELNIKNIYYYLFHLIYYILLIIVNSYDKILFKDKNIKFYLYHIIHFFEKDKKSPEYYYFFYEGAFKFLSKNYNTNINYLFSFNKNVIFKFRETHDIMYIINKFYNQIASKKEKNEDEYNFIGKFRELYSKMMNEIGIYNLEIDSVKNECENLKNKVKKINDIFSKNNVECKELKVYQDKIEELLKIISENNLNDSHFALMRDNFNCKKQFDIHIDKLLFYAKEWIKCNEELNKDYTEKFSQIINSSSFKELYLSAMKSSYVHYFVKDNGYEKNYNLFLEKYSEEIDKYIIYVPLTRGIKAYVANYFRIALNLNSVELIGSSDNENEIIEVYKSYLLVQLLHESFHFIYRLDKKNTSCREALSPEKKKLSQTYKEIGVDLILYLFGTEYITYFSLSNCKLLNNLDSWKNEGTNFKVFNQVYLLGNELKGKDEIKDSGIGLKCNISFYEGNSDDSKLCTDAAIRYCF